MCSGITNDEFDEIIDALEYSTGWHCCGDDSAEHKRAVDALVSKLRKIRDEQS